MTDDLPEPQRETLDRLDLPEPHGFDEMVETSRRLRGYAAVITDPQESRESKLMARAAHEATSQTLTEVRAAIAARGY